MSSPFRTLAVALLAGTAIVSPVLASTFSATELSQDTALLSQFNLVNLGNFSQSASAASTTIQGRALVGGNASFGVGASVCATNCGGNTTAATDGTGSTYGALTVFGNVVAPTTTPLGATAYLAVGSGAADIRGTASGNVLLNATSGSTTGALNIVGSASGMNVGNASAIKTTQSSFAGGNYTYSASTGLVTGFGPTPQVSQSVSNVFPFGTSYSTAQAQALAQGIANLPGSPGVTAQTLPSGNAVFFTAATDNTPSLNGGYKYGVVTTTVANLASDTNMTFSAGNTDATFVIVRGDGANYTLPNLASYATSNKVIFDFVDATTLKFAGNWNGSILAPLATITQSCPGGQTNCYINGSVVVASMTQSNALNDTGLFGGNLAGLVGLSTSVPEPASLALLGMGALAAGAAARRRRR